MKKCIVFLLVLAMALGLSACNTPIKQNEEKTAATTAAAESAAATVTSVAPTTAPTELTTAAPETTVTAAENTEATAVPTETSAATASESPTAEPTAVPTEMPTEDTTPHSELYVPGVSQDEMVEYFNEAVFHMEYTNGEGDTSVVRKWDRPISYRIDGVPNQKDAKRISELSKQLNAVEGFPGIRAATGLEQNVTISFLHDDEFDTKFAHLLDGESADGAVQFWYYSETNNIYSGRIGYRKDVAQEIRDSVIPEEIVNLLGISDTALREDSIAYQSGSEVTELSAVDLAIIKLLYNPKIQCGMNAAECEAIIREMYY